VRAVVRTFCDAVETKAIGASHQFEVVVQVLNNVAGRMLAADNQTEFHRFGSFVMPLSARAAGHNDRISTTS
jgi:hypothetical protein